MKYLKYVEIKLRTSELTTFMKTVPVWELPVIKLVHGNSAIESATDTMRSAIERKRHRNGEFSFIDKTPTGEGEYERLSKRYGKSQTEDGGVGAPYVDVIYGQFGVGTTNLQREIDAATVETVDDNKGFTDLTGETVSSMGG